MSMPSLLSPAPKADLSRRLRLSVCSLLLLLFAYPLLLAALNHFEGFSFANESIAYRWGHASRMVAGDVPPILPQGFTIIAVQEQIVRAIEWMWPPSANSLRHSLQWFCWGTFGIFIACFTTVLVGMARTPQQTADHCLIVFLPWLIALYATGAAGPYYSLLPDYYYLNALLGCAVGWRLLPFIVSIREPGRPTPGMSDVLALGIVLGLGVANKITWGVPCVIALCAVLMADLLPTRRRLVYGVALVASSTLTVALVLLIYYQFSPRILAQGIREWLSFMQTQKGEFALWSPAFNGMFSRYNYDALYSLQLLTMVTGVILVTGWRARVFSVLCLAGFASLLWAASQRPAGSTFWDINILLLLLMSASVLTVAAKRRRQALLAIWLVAIALLVVRQPPGFAASRFAATHVATSNRFEVFQEITRFAGHRPQVIMLANNEYGHGGVHEMLLKAASDFPTWNISVGRAWLKRTGGDITFLHEYGTDMTLPANTAAICVVWFDRPDLPLLTSRYDDLARLARDPDNEVISLPIFIMNLAKPPKVQVWAHALRRKTATPFQSVMGSRLDAPQSKIVESLDAAAKN